ncbi:MAG: 16S rRNA (adenine(1518)-N(6)/adenine(1519)-N(6))-dimethyltransferase RsmA [Candidatus Babeliales bacterium]
MKNFKQPIKKHAFTSKRATDRNPGEPRKKKGLGQHFLRKGSVVDNMIGQVTITPTTSVMEIGCGDGFLTEQILKQTSCKQLRCYEIDNEWLEFVKAKLRDKRLELTNRNILEVDFEEELITDAPWVLLSNLPYNITFPILFRIQKSKHLFQEGVVMVQEEVAQKVVAKSGRSLSQVSFFLQHHFEWQLLEKIEPGAFSPPPKVYSRLLYFKPKTTLQEIPHEDAFWKFVKMCFKSPRQTLRNNLRTTHYASHLDLSIPQFALRSQQMSFADFLTIWDSIKSWHDE